MRSPRTPQASPAQNRPPFSHAVFINCPFDEAYRPLLRAACFTVLACGYAPRCALDVNDSGAVRFHRIVEIITECGWSIHDISRVELDEASRLPRFNMPLELGADLGLRLKGPALQRRRRILVLDSEKHRYDKTLSDISGMDIEAHDNDAVQVMRRVRDWLNANRGETKVLPGAAAIVADYRTYRAIAPDIISALRLDPHDDLPHHDYLQVVRQALPLLERARSAAIVAPVE